MFSSLLKGSSKRKRPLEVRKQTVDTVSGQVPNVPKPSERRTTSHPNLLVRKPSKQQNQATRTHHKRQNVPRARSSSVAVDFGLDGTDSETEKDLASTKKARLVTVGPIVHRNIRCKYAFDRDSAEIRPIVHAAQIPSLDKSTKYEGCFGASEDQVVELQYPSKSCALKERYTLIKPSHDDSAFNAVTEIIHVMQAVSEYFIPNDRREQFDDEMYGYIQRLKRALKKQSVTEFKTTVQSYNDALCELLDSDLLGSQLEKASRVPPRLVEQILNQAYSRTVSPNLKSLRVYEAGTDNVYGELMPRFVSDILTKDVHITPDQVFVDLGSGVGNVVLQAALEIGCESWGCEMMGHFCDIADRQFAEFTARCRMWGLSMGKVCLERGDFLANDVIKGVLRRADVILVNNQVFTPALNEALTTLFLDLKDGCQVVSLKSFVPAGYRITERNSENPLNLLSVQPRTYFSNCVSWTSQGGAYYISTKDSSRLQRFKDDGKPGTGRGA